MIDIFVKIRFFDVLDMLLVAVLMHRVYLLIRGTAAFSIFIGIFSVYLFWRLVKFLQMEILSLILGQVIGVGVIALLIVFQQEIRRFLLFIGNEYFSNRNLGLNVFKSLKINSVSSKVRYKSIVKACINLSEQKVGGLIVIANQSELDMFSQTGEIIKAITTSGLIETIFSKNTPLHDGAIIILNDKIQAARCILPVSQNSNLPASLGLRHRAAIGISEETDAIAVVVSEERGEISYAENGRITTNITPKELMIYFEQKFLIN